MHQAARGNCEVWAGLLACSILPIFPHIARISARVTRNTQPLQSHTYSFRKMSTDPITLYAIGEAVAKRVMFDIESGEWVVAINVNDDENDNENGKGGLVDCEVYFTEESALARQATLLGLADTDAIPDPVNVQGFKHNKVKNCKRKQLIGLLGKEKVKEFCGPTKATPRAADPLVGKSFKMSKMIDFGSGLEYYDGLVKIVSVSGNDKFKLKVSKDGATVEFTEHKALVRGLVASAPSVTPESERVDVTASEYPWKFDVQSGGSFMYSLVKKLPSSKTLPVGMVCALELIDVLEAIELGSTKGHEIDRSADGASEVTLVTEAVLRLACTKLKTVMESNKIRQQPYPCNTPTRLGKAIKRVMEGGIGSKPKVFPLVEQLKGHAESPEEFQMFLKESYMATLEKGRWEMVSSSCGGEYFLSALLEDACKKGGGLSDSEAIGALDYELSAPALLAWLSRITSAPSQPLVAGGGLGSQGAAGTQSTPSSMSGVGAVNVMFHPEPVKTSDQDKKEHEQLREDAESLAKDSTSLALIESMRVVKASGDAEALAKLMSQIKDARLLRLLNASVDLRTAMQGGFADIYRAFDSVRGVLDRRLEVMILGLDVSPKPKTSAAFRALRTGNVHRLRWFHLVELPDDGSAEKPLAALQKLSGEGAKYATSQAMSRAMSIVNLSFPEMVATAALFFPELVARVSEFLDLGVAWAALNEWFAAIVQLMSKPARRLIGGDGSAGVCSISMDVDWLSAPSIFNRKVERAVQLALSKGGKGSGGKGSKLTGRKRPVDKDDDEELATIFKKKKKGGKGKGAGKPRPKLKPKGKKGQDSSEEDEDGADDDDDDGGSSAAAYVKPKGGKKDGDGKWTTLPDNTGALVKAYAKQHAHIPMDERPCWNQEHVAGGCKKQGCKFAH